MIVYKVVSIQGKRFMSCMYPLLADGWAIVYEIGIDAIPAVAGSKLFAFDNAEDAMAWRGRVTWRGGGHAEVVMRCEAEGVEPAGQPAYWYWRGTCLSKYWEQRNSGMRIDQVKLCSRVQGAVVCDSIRPLEVIY